MAEINITDLDTQLENVQTIMEEEVKKNATNMVEVRT